MRKREQLELDLLLQAVAEVTGCDFRHYSQASLKRRVARILEKFAVDSISDLIPRVIHDPGFGAQFVHNVSVTTTEMFRDANFYRSLRENVIPVLRSFPFPKIWHAGCSTGEEVYSMAILLHEEGLLERTQIYATDFNTVALTTAKEGIYSRDVFKAYTRNYIEAGGKADFSDYYVANYGRVKLSEFLTDNVVFSSHNLMRDESPGEMNMILCRNVLIYFDRLLQERVFSLFERSLSTSGILGLGAKETLRFSATRENYVELAPRMNIYKKTRGSTHGQVA